VKPFQPAFPLYERDIHRACADMLDAVLMLPAVWWPYPAGAAQLSPQQQAAMSRIGLKRGLPDLFILYDEKLYGIELKRPGGRVSETRIVTTKDGRMRELIGQADMFPRLIAAGMREIVIAHSVPEMMSHLERWGVPLRGRVAA
jgi:hypothetical protein